MTQPQTGTMARARSLGRIDARVSDTARRRVVSRVGPGLAVVGAGLILWSAAIHLHLWATGYRHISIVGPLFLVQGIAAIPLALALVALRRVVLMLAGAVVLVATAFGLLLSSWVALFGYRESLAVPYAGMSLMIEFGGAVLLLVAAGLTTCWSPAGPRRS